MLKNRNLKKVMLSVAAVALVSIAALGGTFANFTATPTSISNNAFASGALTMARSGSGAIFSASAMKIGDVVDGSVTITNTGSLAGSYTLSGSNSGNSALAGQLQLKVYKDADNSGSPVYSGSLAGFSSASLGTFAANGDSHTFYFHISLPSAGSDTADNTLQGLSTSEAFTWSATQA
jgi:spore coat-associated protein N